MCAVYEIRMEFELKPGPWAFIANWLVGRVIFSHPTDLNLDFRFKFTNNTKLIQNKLAYYIETHVKFVCMTLGCQYVIRASAYNSGVHTSRYTQNSL